MKIQTISILRSLLLPLLAVLSSSTWANSNFISNPYLPYPPSCTQMPNASPGGLAESGAIKFFEGEISLPDIQTFELVGFNLDAYRVPCSEAGRSLVWLEFSLPVESSGKNIEVMLPVAVADYYDGQFKGTPILMNLASEPNTWGADGTVNRERTFLLTQPHGDPDSYGFESYDQEAHSWWFLVDNQSPLVDDGYYADQTISADAYNSRFTLRLRYPPNFNILEMEVPALADMPMPDRPSLTFSGRLSGTWVIDGANDQGFMLAISSLVAESPPDTGQFPKLPLVIFFSQYTFDVDGNMLWLTGSAEFQPGATEINIPIVRVSKGQFRGNQAADRSTIGSITLTANNCNDLTFEYDYSSLGLGSGIRRMQRLFSLETAGYDCRDYAAQRSANQ